MSSGGGSVAFVIGEVAAIVAVRGVADAVGTAVSLAESVA